MKECLRASRVASQEVGQKYAITTFDLGVRIKAYPIIWKSPDFYSDHNYCHDRVISPVLRVSEDDWQENEGVWIHGYSNRIWTNVSWFHKRRCVWKKTTAGQSIVIKLWLK